MSNPTMLVNLLDRLWINMGSLLLPITVCVMLLCLIERVWTDLSPAMRSWLWRLFFIKCCLGLIGINLISHSWLPERSAWWPGSEQSSDSLPSNIVASALQSQSRVENSSQPIGGHLGTTSYGTLALIGWLVGIAIGLGAMATCYGRLARIVWHSQRNLPPELVKAYRRLAIKLGIRRPPSLRLATMIPGPVLTFCGRTHVLVPRAFAQDYGSEAVEMALAHELAHWARRDIYWNGLASLMGLAFFYFPPMWLALRRYRLAQEMACDAWAIKRGELNRAAYASLLLELIRCTRSRSAQAVLSGASLSMARTESFHTLKERLNAMKPMRCSQVVRTLASGLMVLTLIGLALPWTSSIQADEPPASRKPKPRSQFSQGRNYSSPAPSNGNAAAFSFGQSFSSGGASGNAGGYGQSGGGVQGFASGGGFAVVGTPNASMPSTSLPSGSPSSASSMSGNGNDSAPAPLRLPSKVQGFPMGNMPGWPANMPGFDFKGFDGKAFGSNFPAGASVSTVSQNIDGELLSVITVLEKGRELSIRRSDSEGVEVRIRGRGKKAAVETYHADSLSDLERDLPKVYEQIEPYVQAKD